MQYWYKQYTTLVSSCLERPLFEARIGTVLTVLCLFSYYYGVFDCALSGYIAYIYLGYMYFTCILCAMSCTSLHIYPSGFRLNG